MGKLKSSEEIEVTPSPPEAKQRRRCVQSKLCWGRPLEDGGVASVQAAEAVEIRKEETIERETTGKRETKGGTTTTAPKKSPVNRTRSKSSLRSTGYDGCKNLKNDQNGDPNKSDAMKAVDNTSQIVEKATCDLWLEAKLASEENMRLSAGKQIHPFFADRKEAKAQDTKKLEERAQWPGYVRDDINSFPSFHILDAQVDFISLDWSNWKFMELALDLHDCYALENTLVDYKSSVEPLRLDAMSLGEMHAAQVTVAAERNHTIAASNGKYQQQLLPSYLELPIRSNLPLSSRCGSLTENSGNNHQHGLSNERLVSYYRRSSNSTENSMWTVKYQPEKASEICGNCHSVRQLSEWLKSWHDKGQKLGKCKVEVNSVVDDADDSLYETENDMDDQEDASNLRNVLLVTGPVGSGKSAAIYACAKEQGFQVIEVSASDLRNGTKIKNKFQEATESLVFNRWSLYNNTSSRNENLDVLPGAPNIIENVEFENFEIKASPCMQDNGTGGSRVANKLLILFEDVDTVFEEDHGFISTIFQLAKTAKRPIVLTSNSKNPVLPPLLDRLVLDFQAPSVEELFNHVHMICAYEEAQISTCLQQQLIKSCLGDMRKIIMLLQFWCQGKSHGVVRNMTIYSPLLFDIDAAHDVLPVVIPGKFRCELSEKIVDEINRTISSIEEDNFQLVVPTPIVEDAIPKVGKLIKKRKKRRLRRKSLDQDLTEFPTHDIELNDFSDASESLSRFDQRRPKKPRVVLSPESVVKSDADECAEIMSADLNGYSLLDTSIVPSFEEPCPLISLADTKYISQRDNGVRHPFEHFGTVSASHICDTVMLQDVSCVPESSFVAGSEIDKRDNAISMVVPPNNTTVTLSDLVQSIHASREVNNLSGALTQINSFCNNNINEVDLGYVLVSEELGDSQNVDEEFPSGGLQFMDECSRAEFSNYLVSRRYRESSGILSVQETWKKLRNQHEELKSYLNKNQRESSLVNLVSGLTDLISETDILFSGCNPLISDVLVPSLTPCVEPNDVSWYDEQYEMGSTYSQHGLCLYLKDCAKICRDTGFIETGDLVQEMLSSSTNAMALGKSLRLESANTHNIRDVGLQMKETRHETYLGRKPQSVLLDAILPIVPIRLSMTVRNSGFHDYLCFTSRISKLENARISGSMKENCNRRSRSLRHYLSTGSLSLSPKDVELLARTSCFKEVVP